MVASYDYRLVALSVAISMLASYAALDLAGRVTAARGVIRIAWLAGGACAMGMGIWSMHYIGMLAFRLSVVIWYDRLAFGGAVTFLRHHGIRGCAVCGEPAANAAAPRLAG
jgi:NO-binding membrane sensor protein with MHYT domain